MSNVLISIAFMAAGLIGKKASGPAQVTRKIIENLTVNYSSYFEVTLIINNDGDKELIENDYVLKKCKILKLPEVKGNRFKSSRQFYKFIIKNKEIYFDCMHFAVPRIYPFFWKFPAKKFICVFHGGGDVIVHGDKFVLSTYIYNLIMKRSWKYLNTIIADSFIGKKEIIENYKIPGKNIKIIHLGSDHLWQFATNISSKPVTDYHHILIMGRWQKYKNVHSIIHAIKNSNDSRIKNSFVTVIGKSNYNKHNLVAQTILDFPKNRIKILDYLPDANLKQLYGSVDVVVHPSLNEGFGLPAFEAFAEGAKIIVHDGTPASNYLSSFTGVFSGDLLNSQIIDELLVASLGNIAVEIGARRDFLVNNQMTWKAMVDNYVKIYFSTRNILV